MATELPRKKTLSVKYYCQNFVNIFPHLYTRLARYNHNYQTQRFNKHLSWCLYASETQINNVFYEKIAVLFLLVRSRHSSNIGKLKK